MAKIKPLAWCLALALLAPQWAQAQSQPLDAQARARMSEGDSKAALALMQQHLAATPNDDSARLDLVRYLIWNGQYARAEKTLLANPSLAASSEGRVLHANLLAWAERWQSAQAINTELLGNAPEDLMANYNQAIILRQTAKPGLATPYVDKVELISPGSKDALDLRRGTWIRTASFVALDWQASSDTIGIDSEQAKLLGSFVVNDAWHITGEASRNRFSAPISSGYAPIYGGSSLDENRALIGAQFAPQENILLHLAAGQSTIPSDSTTLWRAKLDFRISDSWQWNISADHDRVTISPLSTSLGLTRNAAIFSTRFTPNLNWTANASLRLEEYSDSNSREEFNLSLSRAIVRQPGFMLDLGGAWQQLHYDFDPGNGYYAPNKYQRYGITVNSYIGLGENAGLLVQAGLGRQHDENFSRWRSANDISAELVVGIFSAWEWRVRAAHSQRVQNVGAYDGTSWGVTLTRRF